jgi:hypothetical protein
VAHAAKTRRDLCSIICLVYDNVAAEMDGCGKILLVDFCMSIIILINSLLLSSNYLLSFSCILEKIKLRHPRSDSQIVDTTLNLVNTR